MKWPPSLVSRVTRPFRRQAASRCSSFPAPRTRWLSTLTDYRVAETPCGSAGNVAISLFNITTQQTSTPLVLYIPPFPSPTPSITSIPSFLRPYPTAIIHYRWRPSPSPSSSSPPPPCPLTEDGRPAPWLHWPTPVHDVAYAYAWIAEHLAPPGLSRRPILVLSSHLGASLAASLALTEAHPHRPFAVRSVALFNGVYNWTMFLPDHRAHRLPSSSSKKKSLKTAAVGDDGEEWDMEAQYQGCRMMGTLGKNMARFFLQPVNLFDAFASPALMFQTPGMDVPSSFTRSEELSSQIDWLASLSSSSPLPTNENSDDGDESQHSQMPKPPTPPRRSPLIFPPRSSTLKIPETLLLYTRPPPVLTKSGKVSARVRKPRGNTFETQALEMAGLMRRSVEKLEVKERRFWDDEYDDSGEVSERRVGLHEVGEGDPGDGGMTAQGTEVVSRWLEDKFGF